MTIRNTLKQVAYDHPACEVRGVWQMTMSAGSLNLNSGAIAHADLLILGVSGITNVAGTSTFTGTQYFNGGNDVATVHANSQLVAVCRIYNSNGGMFGTGTPGALTTDTIAVGYASRYYANGTATGGVNTAWQFAVNQTDVPGGFNGYRINAGDEIRIRNGTDATHVSRTTGVTIEWALAPNANIIA